MTEHEAHNAIDEGNAKFMKFYESGDIKSLTELFTEDCTILAPGVEVQRGRKALEDFLKMKRASGVAKIILRSDEKGGTGELVYDCGGYSLVKDDGAVIENGKSIVLWKKVDGAYYFHIDCFNSNEK